jgi:hypothetical protein
VDTALRTLADAALALDAAEEALDAGEPTAAEEHLATIDAALATVREAWPALSQPARAVVGPAGKDVRARHDALARRLPKRRALSDGTPETPDPDEETEPV